MKDGEDANCSSALLCRVFFHWEFSLSVFLQTGKVLGRKLEKVVFDFWKQIKREMPYDADLSKLLIDGEDKTEIIKEME